MNYNVKHEKKVSNFAVNKIVAIKCKKQGWTPTPADIPLGI